MGLDMMIRKEYFVDKDRHKLKIDLDGQEILKNVHGVKITADVIHWRKLNPIHKWMVDNVQNGEDNCGDYTLSVGNMKALLREIVKCIRYKDIAPEVLPCCDGPHYGLCTDEPDEYRRHFEEEYILAVSSIKQLIQDMEEAGASGADIRFYYTSSW